MPDVECNKCRWPAFYVKENVSTLILTCDKCGTKKVLKAMIFGGNW